MEFLQSAATVIVLMLLSSDPAAGQGMPAADRNTYPIDLSTALRFAGTNSLRIAEAEAQLRDASGQKLSAYERFFPSLTAEWLLVRHAGRTQATEGEFLDVDKQYDRVGGALTATWDLGEALFAALATQRRHQAAAHALDNVTDSALLAVANSYFSLAEATANVRIAQHAVGNSSDFVQQTDNAIRDGVGFRADLLRARTQLAHDKLSLRLAEEETSAASARLVSLLNLDEPVTLTPLDSTLVPLALVDTIEGVEQWIEQAIRTHPHVLAQGSKLAAVRIEKKQAIWGPLLPEIEGQAQFSSFGPVWSDLHRSRDYRVSVRWTLGPGGLFDLGRIRSRSASLDIAQSRYESTLNAVEEDVIRSHAQLKSRGAMLAIAREGLDVAKETLSLAQGRRDIGIGLGLEVITAAEALTRAENDYARTVIDYNRAQVETLTVLGLLRATE